MKKCPYCAEEIQDEAIVCRYCGRDLQKPGKPQSQKPPANSNFRALFGVFLLIMICWGLSRGITGDNIPATPTAETTAEGANSVVIITYTPVETSTPQPTRTPQPSPTLNIGLINEPREVSGIVLTILDVARANAMDFLTADQGYTYLILDVTIENVGRAEESPYNPLYFSVKDSDGYEYNATGYAREPSLKSGTLLKGDKVRGFVAFEIRSISKGLVVTYEPLVLLGGYEPIRIALDGLSLAKAGQGTPVNNACETCNFECPAEQGEFEFCVVDPALVLDRSQFERVVQEYCKAKGGSFCKMLIWTDLSDLPDALPMSDAQLNNQVADYTRNISTGINCLKLLAAGSVIYSSNGCN